MSSKRRCLYGIVACIFFTAFIAFQVWAKEEVRGTKTKQLKGESQQLQAPIQEQPKITFDSITFDAGEIWEGQEVSHDFIVKNTGTAQLEIKSVKPG